MPAYESVHMQSPFIHRYQPLYLKDFEMCDELRSLIRTLIGMDTLNVLFIGDSGCGKSSIIHAIVREVYGPQAADDDILYINSLKDQGISYYRTEVKTFCQTAPSVSGRKKMLVLDDLDTINEQSQQVFRNCIDKYSHNVHFVASCTDTQKTIDSLQSRMTLVRVKALTRCGLARVLEKVTRAEDLRVTDDAKDFILRVSNNSARVLINHLEKLKLIGGEVTAEMAMKTCTSISFHEFDSYIAECREADGLAHAVTRLYGLFDRGYSVMDILDSLFLFVKATSTLTDGEKYAVVPLLCRYITIFNDVHEDEIELALLTNNIHTSIRRFVGDAISADTV
jgi:DNA polymerase III delta prime subunit